MSLSFLVFFEIKSEISSLYHFTATKKFGMINCMLKVGRITMRQIIFHIDVNSAFLSWTAVEELKNGSDRDLREIPSIIGGDQQSRRGVQFLIV